MSDNGAHKILLCRLCSLREKYLPVPSPLLILCWQGPEKQFLWWNKYAFISLVQTRSFLKEEEREKFKPFLPLISSLLAAISPRPQTKKANIGVLSPCYLHLHIWIRQAEIVDFISSRQTSYNQYQFLSADMIGKNHLRPDWFELRHAFSSFFWRTHLTKDASSLSCDQHFRQQLFAIG